MRFVTYRAFERDCLKYIRLESSRSAPDKTLIDVLKNAIVLSRAHDNASEPQRLTWNGSESGEYRIIDKIMEVPSDSLNPGNPNDRITVIDGDEYRSERCPMCEGQGSVPMEHDHEYLDECDFCQGTGFALMKQNGCENSEERQD